MKNKITLITHYFNSHIGGIEIAAYEIAKSLSDDFEINWFASKLQKNETIENINCKPIPCINLLESFFGIPYPLWNPLYFFKIWSSIKNSQIVHIHDCLYLGSIAGFIFSKLLKKPLVITQHIGEISYGNILLNMFVSFLYKTIGKVILTYSDKVIFSSYTARDYFFRFCKFKNEPIMILNSINESLFFNDNIKSDVYRKKLGLPPEKRIFLFIGRFLEKKGLDVIKELAKQFKDITWLLIGWGQVNPKEWNLDNVIVIGKVARENIAQYYKAADLLILPSQGEGFSLVVHESMACGTPCLVSAEILETFSEIQEYIFTAPVKTDPILNWSKKINELISGSEIAEKKEKLPVIVKHYWDTESCKKRYINEFEKLIR